MFRNEKVEWRTCSGKSLSMNDNVAYVEILNCEYVTKTYTCVGTFLFKTISKWEYKACETQPLLRVTQEQNTK